MDPAAKARLLRYALRGLLLTERDERVLGWAGQQWTPEAVEAVATWIETVRESAFLDGLGLRRATEEAAEGRTNGRTPGVDPGGIIGGNSGPGW